MLTNPWGAKKVRPIRSSSYLTIYTVDIATLFYVTKNFDIKFRLRIS